MNLIEKYYTVAEVADQSLLGLKKSAIRKLLKNGELGSVDVSPEGSKRTAVRIPQSAIEEFLAKRKQQ